MYRASERARGPEPRPGVSNSCKRNRPELPLYIIRRPGRCGKMLAYNADGVECVCLLSIGVQFLSPSVVWLVEASFFYGREVLEV